MNEFTQEKDDAEYLNQKFTNHKANPGKYH
jgi:hypothetical protein